MSLNWIAVYLLLNWVIFLRVTRFAVCALEGDRTNRIEEVSVNNFKVLQTGIGTFKNKQNLLLYTEVDQVYYNYTRKKYSKDSSRSFDIRKQYKKISILQNDFHVLKKRSLKNAMQNESVVLPRSSLIWSACNATQCGLNGTQFRVRKCQNKNSTFDGAGKCEIKLNETRSCVKICEKNVTDNLTSWTQWSMWSSCSNTCGTGEQARQRTCTYVATRLSKDNESFSEIAVSNERNFIRNANFSLCPGGLNMSVERKPCHVIKKCRRRWSKWGNWSTCSVSCGIGFEEKTRVCLGAPTDGLKCGGHSVKFRRCYLPPCWTAWSSFSNCPSSCSRWQRYRVRRRQCKGTSQLKEKYQQCSGSGVQRRRCPNKPCSSWGQWSSYGGCSKTCGRGVKRRTRQCLGQQCLGKSYQTTPCFYRSCPSWSSWASYTCCSATCGSNGFKQRRRICRNSRGRRNACAGLSRDRVKCDLPPCTSKTVSIFDTFQCGVPKQPKANKMFRIYGGRQARENRWPWQGSLQRKSCSYCHWVHVCGATLVAPKWLITASHCVKKAKTPINSKTAPNSWSIMLGMHKLYQDGERYYLEKIISHPNYKSTYVTIADIALLKLRKLATLSSKISPACLPKIKRPSTKSVCYITGWGRSKPQRGVRTPLSRVLKEAKVPILTFSACQNLGWSYRMYLKRRYHLCAGRARYADSCTGDSGGPLSCRSSKGNWFLAGITSFGFTSCGKRGHTGIYVPINNFQWWIRRTIERNELGIC